MISLKTSVICAACVSIALMLYSAAAAIYFLAEGSIASFLIMVWCLGIGVYCTIKNYQTYNRIRP